MSRTRRGSAKPYCAWKAATIWWWWRPQSTAMFWCWLALPSIRALKSPRRRLPTHWTPVDRRSPFPSSYRYNILDTCGKAFTFSSYIQVQSSGRLGTGVHLSFLHIGKIHWTPVDRRSPFFSTYKSNALDTCGQAFTYTLQSDTILTTPVKRQSPFLFTYR